jgi:hypothetical protein
MTLFVDVAYGIFRLYMSPSQVRERHTSLTVNIMSTYYTTHNLNAINRANSRVFPPLETRKWIHFFFRPRPSRPRVPLLLEKTQEEALTL